ncbi:MAG: hypothetical protein ABW148_18535 [Sedimenticola sp.]
MPIKPRGRVAGFFHHMLYGPQKSLRHSSFLSLHFFPRPPLFLILLLSLLSVALESAAEVVPKMGHVMTCGLVLGPNQQPIFAEVNESGVFVNDIGEAVGAYDKARVMLGESYRSLYGLPELPSGACR